MAHSHCGSAHQRNVSGRGGDGRQRGLGRQISSGFLCRFLLDRRGARIHSVWEWSRGTEAEASLASGAADTGGFRRATSTLRASVLRTDAGGRGHHASEGRGTLGAVEEGFGGHRSQGLAWNPSSTSMGGHLKRPIKVFAVEGVDGVVRSANADASSLLPTSSIELLDYQTRVRRLSSVQVASLSAGHDRVRVLAREEYFVVLEVIGVSTTVHDNSTAIPATLTGRVLELGVTGGIQVSDELLVQPIRPRPFEGRQLAIVVARHVGLK